MKKYIFSLFVILLATACSEVDNSVVYGPLLDETKWAQEENADGVYLHANINGSQTCDEKRQHLLFYQDSLAAQGFDPPYVVEEEEYTGLLEPMPIPRTVWFYKVDKSSLVFYCYPTVITGNGKYWTYIDGEKVDIKEKADYIVRLSDYNGTGIYEAGTVRYVHYGNSYKITKLTDQELVLEKGKIRFTREYAWPF